MMLYFNVSWNSKVKQTRYAYRYDVQLATINGHDVEDLLSQKNSYIFF